MRSPLPGAPRSTVCAPRRRDVERVVEQDMDVADRAVGLHLVDAEAVGEGRDGRLELEREAHRAVAGQEGLVGDAVDRRRIDAHAFGQAGQVVDVGHAGMGVAAAAARRQDEGAVAGEAAVELDGRSAGADRGLARRYGNAVPVEPQAQHVDGAEAELAHHVAVEIGQAVAQGRVARRRTGSCRRRRRRSPCRCRRRWRSCRCRRRPSARCRGRCRSACRCRCR